MGRGMSPHLDAMSFSHGLQARGVNFRVEGEALLFRPRRLLEESEVARLGAINPPSWPFSATPACKPWFLRPTKWRPGT